MEIQFTDFGLNQAVVANCIYRDFPHQTTSQGVVLSAKVKAELERFLEEYNAFLKVEQAPYYRIDAYFDQNALWVLEVNAAFVDGWGTALNLSRASWISLDPKAMVFPKLFATVEEEYLPELQLLVDELAVLGIKDREIVPYSSQMAATTYVYGRILMENGNNQALPYDGLRLDNKLNLGLFSREWQGKYVKVPQHYMRRFETWDQVLSESVLKFTDKNSPESHQARTSVLMNKPEGKAKFLRSCYEAETLIAQRFVQPTTHPLGNAQLILLTIGNAPVTGYVQFSRKAIINDNSTHGPLCIE